MIISALLALVFLNIMGREANAADISFPDTTWALLGISAGTAVAQPFVNNNTASNEANRDEKDR